MYLKKILPDITSGTLFSPLSSINRYVLGLWRYIDEKLLKKRHYCTYCHDKFPSPPPSSIIVLVATVLCVSLLYIYVLYRIVVCIIVCLLLASSLFLIISFTLLFFSNIL